jgi:hypothetical protein
LIGVHCRIGSLEASKDAKKAVKLS